MYSITSQESFEAVESYLVQIQRVKDLHLRDIPCYLVGSKVDLDNERKVSKEQLQRRAQQYGIKYMESSAKNDVNVKNVMEDVVLMALQNRVYCTKSLPVKQNNNKCTIM